VVYKVDGNSIGHGGTCSNSAKPIVPTPIMLQQVGSDGVSLIGAPIQLITNDAVDGSSVEAPTILYGATQKIYFLLYSSGCFTASSYSVRVASATSLTGPWTKASAPFLVTGQTAADVYIPGGVDVTADGSKIVFHGDLNLGWFSGNGARVRGMFAAQAVTYANQAWVGDLL
jgi:beta-xylosidase